jgi:hypothetical protein
MTYAVLFKIYFLDAFVVRQLERLRDRVGEGHVYVIVDETRGEVGPIPHDRVIRVTEDEMFEAGFENGPSGQSMFWYNSDYSLFCLFDRHPAYDYYVTVEYDAVINGDIDQLAAAVAASGLDFVGEKIKKPMSEWPWAKTCRELYAPESILGYLSPIAFYTPGAIQALRDSRLKMSARFRAGEISQFPLSEAFIPTELGVQGFRLGNLSDFGDATKLDWWPPTDEAELGDFPDCVFIHPVLQGVRYVDSLLRTDQLRRLFAPDSVVRAKLARLPPRDYLPRLTAGLVNLTRGPGKPFHVGQQPSALFEREQPGASIALGKPATQSSVSRHSRNPDVRLDAAGAVNGLVTGSFSFHTGFDSPPWWMVDLEGLYLISEVWVFNRLDMPGRAQTLQIYTSRTGREWALAYEHPVEQPIRGAFGQPLIVAFADRPIVRFVRIELRQTDFLHLDQVKIFGERHQEPPTTADA